MACPIIRDQSELGIVRFRRIRRLWPRTDHRSERPLKVCRVDGSSTMHCCRSTVPDGKSGRRIRAAAYRKSLLTLSIRAGASRFSKAAARRRLRKAMGKSIRPASLRSLPARHNPLLEPAPIGAQVCIRDAHLSYGKRMRLPGSARPFLQARGERCLRRSRYVLNFFAKRASCAA